MYKFLYIVMCIVALTIYGMQRLELRLPSLINNYVNDFLCLPIILGGISYSIRKLKKDASFKLSIVFVLFLASYYSLYFEYYLPKVNKRYTADWIDVSLYFSSAFLFLLFERYKLRLKRKV